MKRLAFVLVVSLAVVACGGDSGATSTPVPEPTVSADLARQYALEGMTNQFRSDLAEPDVTLQRMLAWQANEEFQRMGFDPLPLASAIPTCAPAPSCGGPRLPYDESGFLVVVTGLPDSRALSPIEPGRKATALAWVSDSGALVSAPPRYQ